MAEEKQLLIRSSKHDRVKRLAASEDREVRDVYRNLLVKIAAEPESEQEKVVMAKPLVSDAVWGVIRRRAKAERVSIPVLVEREIDKLSQP